MRVLVLLLIFCVQTAHAQMPGGSTWANSITLQFLTGDYGGTGYVDGNGRAARVSASSGLVADSSGNLLFVDDYTIRRVSSAGQVSLFAGQPGVLLSQDGTGINAAFRFPASIVRTTSGDYFVSEYSAIRKMTTAGVVTTFAGSATTTGSANGTGLAARFSSPDGMAVDSAGNLFVADSQNHTIRKITPAGVVTTFAGTAGSSGSTDGTGSAARFNYPTGLAIDASDNLFVSDKNNFVIRKITPAAVVTTFAGTAGSTGLTNGAGSAAKFGQVGDVVIDSSGNLFVADSGNKLVRKITPGAVVSTFAGGSSVKGADGVGNAANFNSVLKLAIDSSGNVYVADYYTLRKIAPDATVSTIAGRIDDWGNVNGAPGVARLWTAEALVADSSGNLYVSDSNSSIRKVSSAGVVSAFAGSTSNVSGSTNGTGTAARFLSISQMATDSAGNIYAAEFQNRDVRKITPAGVVTTLAGDPSQSGTADGTGSAALFNTPQGIAVDSAGNVFVADANNHNIRKITPAGVVTTFAGSTTATSGTANGTGTAARFNRPAALAIDASNNLYVADQTNNTIRKITPAGVVTTFAGTAGTNGFVDATGTSARFSSPTSLVCDQATGNLYVSEYGNKTIRKITPAGVVKTVSGNGRGGVALGTLPAQPGVAQALVIANGKLYITTESAILFFSRLP
jgi:sugar lactone lactonase YvrE